MSKLGKIDDSLNEPGQALSYHIRFHVYTA